MRTIAALVLLLIVLAILSTFGAISWLSVWSVLAVFVVLFASGIRIVRPTQRGLIERLGNYKRVSRPGFNWIIPFIDSIIRVNITEQMVDAEKQEIITKDRLNATVDAQVYFKVRPEEESVKASQYNVQNYRRQIVALSKTTLRNIIGNMSYEEANSERERINDELKKILIKEAKPWGIEIVRTEMKEIDPPKDVQSSMNEVIKAENTKNAAKDLAQAAETKADGERRAAIKVADGEREAAVLRANGEGQAIERIAKANAEKYKLENEALQKYFKNEAQIYKKLDVTENSLKAGTKYVIDKQTGITNVISDTAGVVPIPKDSAKKTRSKESEPDVTLVSEHSKEKTPMTMGRRR